MEQVFVSLTIDSSGVHSDGIKAFCIKFTSVLNVRNNTMQIANAPVIRT
jgi:hypothetical protein